MPDGCYDPMIFPYDGVLCGPAATPCVVQASETIEALAVSRNGTPSVAVDDDCNPSVLHGQSAGGVLGFFDQRVAANMWDVQATPFPMVEGGLDFDPTTGFFGAMVYEGSFDVAAHTYDGVWSAGDVLLADFSLTSKAFALTGDPVLNGFLRESGVGWRDATWDGAWIPAVASSGGPSDVSAALAVAADGTHHATYWSLGGMDPMLVWETSAGDLETIMPYGNPIVSSALAQEIALTSQGGPVVPNVLAGTETGLDGRVQVMVATRTGAMTWDAFVVATEDPTGETTCDVPPVMPGEVCTLDRTLYRPLAIVSSQGGDLRWFYSETRELVDYESVCKGNCVWSPVADMSTYATFMGWFDAGVPDAVALLPNTRLARANAEVDGQGTIHLVAYALPIPADLGNGLTVEYFRIAQ